MLAQGQMRTNYVLRVHPQGLGLEVAQAAQEQKRAGEQDDRHPDLDKDEDLAKPGAPRLSRCCGDEHLHRRLLEGWYCPGRQTRNDGKQDRDQQRPFIDTRFEQSRDDARGE